MASNHYNSYDSPGQGMHGQNTYSLPGSSREPTQANTSRFSELHLPGAHLEQPVPRSQHQQHRIHTPPPQHDNRGRLYPQQHSTPFSTAGSMRPPIPPLAQSRPSRARFPVDDRSASSDRPAPRPSWSPPPPKSSSVAPYHLPPGTHDQNALPMPPSGHRDQRPGSSVNSTSMDEAYPPDDGIGNREFRWCASSEDTSSSNGSNSTGPPRSLYITPTSTSSKGHDGHPPLTHRSSPPPGIIDITASGSTASPSGEGIASGRDETRVTSPQGSSVSAQTRIVSLCNELLPLIDRALNPPSSQPSTELSAQPPLNTRYLDPSRVSSGGDSQNRSGHTEQRGSQEGSSRRMAAGAKPPGTTRSLINTPAYLADISDETSASVPTSVLSSPAPSTPSVTETTIPSERSGGPQSVSLNFQQTRNSTPLSPHNSMRPRVLVVAASDSSSENTVNYPSSPVSSDSDQSGRCDERPPTPGPGIVPIPDDTDDGLATAGNYPRWTWDRDAGFVPIPVDSAPPHQGPPRHAADQCYETRWNWTQETGFRPYVTPHRPFLGTGLPPNGPEKVAPVISRNARQPLANDPVGHAQHDYTEVRVPKYKAAPNFGLPSGPRWGGSWLSTQSPLVYVPPFPPKPCGWNSLRQFPQVWNGYCWVA